MLDYTLLPEKLSELRAAHHATRDKREADRTKAVVLLATGWSAEQVAEVLLIDPNTVRSHFKRYQQGGLKSLSHVAFLRSKYLLDAEQLALLDLHVQSYLYVTTKAIACWIKESLVSVTPKSV